MKKTIGKKRVGFTPTPFSENFHIVGEKQSESMQQKMGAIRASGEKVRGFTCGAFDLCHAGHMLVFKEAKEICDHLVVLLQEDPSLDGPAYRGKAKNRPVMSLPERRLILEGNKYIDEIITYTSEADLYQKLKNLKADIRIIGADWKGKKFTGHDLPFEVYYNSRNHGYSTTELRARVHKAEEERLKNTEEKI